jgi:hypothetical protein
MSARATGSTLLRRLGVEIGQHGLDLPAAALGAQRMGLLVLSDVLAALERLAALLAAILIGWHAGILHGNEGGAQFEVTVVFDTRVVQTVASSKMRSATRRVCRRFTNTLTRQVLQIYIGARTQGSDRVGPCGKRASAPRREVELCGRQPS